MVSKYYGIDVSQTTIEITMKNAQKRKLPMFFLEQFDASEVEKTGFPRANCIVINVVEQYFHGYNYYLDVINKCISIIRDRGVIFLVDILSFEMIEDFEQKLSEVSGKGSNIRDLWYPQKLIEAIPTLIDCVDRIESSS